MSRWQALADGLVEIAPGRIDVLIVKAGKAVGSGRKRKLRVCACAESPARHRGDTLTLLPGYVRYVLHQPDVDVRRSREEFHPISRPPGCLEFGSAALGLACVLDERDAACEA